jgi:hypothetical protein
MIDRCEPAVAGWSDSGDNFVVKNVEKFASVSSEAMVCLVTGSMHDMMILF